MVHKLFDVEWGGRQKKRSLEAENKELRARLDATQEVEKRRHDLMPEHQKAQEKSQKIQCIQDTRRYLQKDSIAAEEEMRKLRGELRQKEERVLFLSNNIDKE